MHLYARGRRGEMWGRKNVDKKGRCGGRKFRSEMTSKTRDLVKRMIHKHTYIHTLLYIYVYIAPPPPSRALESMVALLPQNATRRPRGREAYLGTHPTPRDDSEKGPSSEEGARLVCIFSIGKVVGGDGYHVCMYACIIH